MNEQEEEEEDRQMWTKTILDARRKKQIERENLYLYIYEVF